MKKTKIVATIGPASEKTSTIKRMLQAGMNVCRLNFSHGTHTNHAQLIHSIRDASKLSGLPVAILQDLQGPRIRLGMLPPEGVELSQGDKVTLKPESLCKGHSSHKVLPSQYGKLAKEVKKGQIILFKDGLMRVQVTKVDNLSLVCEVLEGGLLKSHQGMNVPGANLSIPVMTDKDRRDILFGVRHNIDWIALSFVKDGHDIQGLREFVVRHGGSQGIIAKIERMEAIENLEGILDYVDGVMIARGDLGVELPPEKVPVLQKEIIQMCLERAKPVIVATQMLESMISSPRPTRAEASDVANAVVDQADAVMLSGESAFGKYPLQAVDMMRKIIEEMEATHYDERERVLPKIKGKFEEVDDIARGIARMCKDSSLNLIIALAADPYEVQLISRYRPEARILVMTDEHILQKRLSLTYGAYTEVVHPEYTLDTLLKKALVIAHKKGLAKKGERALVVAGQKLEKKHEMCVVSIMDT